MNEHILLTNVTKIFPLGLFKKKTAVEDLTLTVPQGKVIGLLGPNGSGKSTTLKMILGFLKPTSGEIRVCGHSTTDRNARRFIGYLPENPKFQKFLRAREILHYYGSLHQIGGIELKKRTEYYLELVGLRQAADERVQGYSKGMTQRLALAQALINHPELLIFDEPMSGLDPLGRIEIRKLIGDIHAEMPQSTIFFSSHILEDVEQLCSMVALLKKGKLKRYSPIEELILNEEQRFEIIIRGLDAEEEASLGRVHPTRKTALGTNISVTGTQNLMKHLEILKSLGATVIGVNSHKRGLEQALFRDSEQEVFS